MLLGVKKLYTSGKMVGKRWKQAECGYVVENQQFATFLRGSQKLAWDLL